MYPVHSLQCFMCPHRMAKQVVSECIRQGFDQQGNAFGFSGIVWEFWNSGFEVKSKVSGSRSLGLRVPSFLLRLQIFLSRGKMLDETNREFRCRDARHFKGGGQQLHNCLGLRIYGCTQFGRICSFIWTLRNQSDGKGQGQDRGWCRNV